MGHISNTDSYRLNITSNWKHRSYAIPERYFQSYFRAYQTIDTLTISLNKLLFNIAGVIISHITFSNFFNHCKISIFIYHGQFEDLIRSDRKQFFKTALKRLSHNNKLNLITKKFGNYNDFLEKNKNISLPKNFFIKLKEPENTKYYTNIKVIDLINKHLPNKTKLYLSKFIKPTTIETEKIIKNYKNTESFNMKKNNCLRNENNHKIYEKEIQNIKLFNYKTLNFDTRYKFIRTNKRLLRNKSKFYIYKNIKWYFAKLYKKQKFYLRDSFRYANQPLIELFQKELSIKFNKKTEIIIKAIHAQNVTASIINRFVKVRLQQFDTFNEIVFPMARHMFQTTYWTGFLVRVAGRINRQQRASFNEYKSGKTPFGTFSYPLDFAYDAAILKYGTASIRIWISRGFKKQQDGKIMKNLFKFSII